MRPGNSPWDTSCKWSVCIAGKKSGQVLRTQCNIKKKVKAVPRRERIHNQWVPKIKFAGSEFEKWRTTWNFIFLFQLGATEIQEISDFGKNFHPFLASASFPNISSAGSRVSVVSWCVPTWVSVVSDVLMCPNLQKFYNISEVQCSGV